MKPLTNDQREEIKKIYEWGHFMNAVMKYKQDAGANDLTDEDVFLLIDAESNLDLFSDYVYESEECELCGSHGSVTVTLGDKQIVMKEW